LAAEFLLGWDFLAGLILVGIFWLPISPLSYYYFLWRAEALIRNNAFKAGILFKRKSLQKEKGKLAHLKAGLFTL
jgi:hypothetical protein